LNCCMYRRRSLLVAKDCCRFCFRKCESVAYVASNAQIRHTV
jgi:hypothetical protein